MRAPNKPEPKKKTLILADVADLGEIEAAVLCRHGIGVGQAAGYFAQIIAAAELGGASWETRLKAACRKGEK